jgi:hypothetical protein
MRVVNWARAGEAAPSAAAAMIVAWRRHVMWLLVVMARFLSWCPVVGVAAVVRDFPGGRPDLAAGVEVFREGRWFAS